MPRISLTTTLLAAVAACSFAACEKKASNDAEALAQPSASARPLRPLGAVSARAAGSAVPAGEKMDVISNIRVRAKDVTSVKLDWKLPAGTALNDEAPFRVRWDSSEGLTEAPSDLKSTGSAVKAGLTLKVKTMPTAPQATLDGELNLVVCDAVNHAICLPVRRSLQLGFVVAADAPAETSVAIQLPSAK